MSSMLNNRDAGVHCNYGDKMSHDQATIATTIYNYIGVIFLPILSGNVHNTHLYWISLCWGKETHIIFGYS